MDIPRLPETLDLSTIQALRKAFGHFYDLEQTSKFVDPLTGLHFTNVTNFVDYLYSSEIGIPKGTSIKHIGITLESWYETLSKASTYSESTETPAPKILYESNTLTPEQLAAMQAESEEKSAKIKAIKEEAEKQVRASIKRGQEIHSRQEEYNRIREALAGKKVVISPKSNFTEVSLTPQEKVRIYNLAQAIKGDSTAVQAIIEQKIQESVSKSPEDVKQNVNQTIIELTSKNLVDKISTFSEYEKSESIPDNIITYNPASPFAAISGLDDIKLQEIIPDDQARIEFIHNAKAIAISFEAKNNLESALIQPLFEDSENIRFLFYPTKIAEFQISENQNDHQTKDEGIEIDISNVYDQGKQVWNTWNKLANKEITINDVIVSSPRVSTSTALIEASKSASAARLSFPKTMGSIVGLRATNLLAIAPLSSKVLMIPGQQVVQMVIGGNASRLALTSAPTFGTITKFIVNPTTIGTKTAFFIGKGVTMGGQNMLGASLSIGESKVALAITSKGVSMAATGVFAKILGFFTGPIGFIVTTIGAWLLSKVDWSKVKKAAPYILGFLTALIFSPFIGFGGAIAAGVGIGVLTGIASGGTSLGAVGAGIGVFFKSLGGIMVASIGTPLLVTLLVFPILVAFILFIINSGAYVVPLSDSTFGRTSNPYIDVIKTPEPPGPFTNKELPKTITYKITVKAKRSVLTNVSIKYDCKVISTANKNCPPTSVAPATVDSISPSLPYTFTYTSTYDNSFINSAIIDTVTVTADTGEVVGTTTETSASVTFGTPPISCPVPAATALNQNNYSYNVKTNTGHGSTSYWAMMGGTPYRYALPQWTGCKTPADCSYYGYSYDVFPTGINTVYAPTVLGKETTWSLSGTGINGSAVFTVIYKDSTGSYSLVLTHVASTIAPKTVTSGQKITTLFNQGSNTHLHLEFQMNGRWVKPEDYFCK